MQPGINCALPVKSTYFPSPFPLFFYTHENRLQNAALRDAYSFVTPARAWCTSANMRLLPNNGATKHIFGSKGKDQAFLVSW